MNVEKTSLEALNCKRGVAQFVMQGKQTQTPLLSKMYLARQRLLHHVMGIASEACDRHNTQLLNLGGGLDNSYSKYVARQFVVDLPDTLSKLPIQTELPSNTVYIACNLEKTDLLMQQLIANGFDILKPTIILMECVLAYIDPVSVEALLNLLSRDIKSSILIAYDPICNVETHRQNSYTFSRLMLQRFRDRKAPLLSAVSSTTAFTYRMLKCSWPFARTYTLSHALQLLLGPQDGSLYVHGELFDEFASLQTLLNLYGLCLAGTNKYWYSTWSTRVKYCSKSDHEVLPADRKRYDILCAGMESVAAHVLALEQFRAVRERSSNENKCLSLSFNNVNDCNIRSVQSGDIEAVVELYTTNFAAYALADKSVKKYVNSATKQLRDMKRKFDDELVPTGSSTKTLPTKMEHFLWVSVPDISSIDESMSRILGMIGIKRWKSNSELYSSSEVQNTSDRFEIVHFCVSSAVRERGIGSNLLSEAFAFCRNQGASSVSLTVLSSFVEARRMYAKYGFAETGQDIISPLCTMIHMEKQL